MPFPLLLAIFLAFGFEVHTESGALAAGELTQRTFLALGGVAFVGLFAIVVGKWIEFRVARCGRSTPLLRRSFAVASRAVDVLTLGVYAWIIYAVDWPAAVEWGLGLHDAILLDEFLVLLPFLLAQVLGWWGMYPAERALRPEPMRVGRRRYLLLKARQSLGLVLPVALVFSLGQDLLRRQWPGSTESAWVQLGWMAAMGALVLVLAPAFVRLTWPTRPLSGGPLRDRLERLSYRYRFRCTDILVWDTGQALVNAGVTGALPWFRYVLLTDALIENLEPSQVEAVFGHEVGHVAHRHLSYFGFFFLGSIGVMSLVNQVIERHVNVASLAEFGTLWTWTGANAASLALVVQAVGTLGCLALYFLLVFGFLSRRFERQADVFGCRAVSCGRPTCPPHADLNAQPVAGPVASVRELCPAGIRIFASALADVASLNGMERESWWAWRHGSIARRIAFLEALEGRPEDERRFQRRIRHLQLGLAVLLASALFLAVKLGALNHLS